MVTLSLTSHYTYKNKSNDHCSTVNPVADLFALACCPVMLATPTSGYFHGSRLPRWRAAGRTGSDVMPLDDKLSDVPLDAPADTSWL